MKNYGSRRRASSRPARPSDFTTDLGVFQDGREIARKTIRVNDPLAVGGYTFHENGFGAAPVLLLSDAAGKPLWDGPVPLTDQANGLPYGTMSVPGRDIGLSLLLKRVADGTGILIVVPYRVGGTATDGSPAIEYLDGPPSPWRPARRRLRAGSTSRSAVGVLRLHPADREEGPGAGDRLDRVRGADRRSGDHVLPPRRRIWARSIRPASSGSSRAPTVRRPRTGVRAAARRPRRPAAGRRSGRGELIPDGRDAPDGHARRPPRRGPPERALAGGRTGPGAVHGRDARPGLGSPAPGGRVCARCARAGRSRDRAAGGIRARGVRPTRARERQLPASIRPSVRRGGLGRSRRRRDGGRRHATRP